jgi:polysaccharide biosynthesis protein PslH
LPIKFLAISTYKYIKPTDGGKNGIYYLHKYLAKFVDLVVAGMITNEADESIRYKLIPIFGRQRLRYANPFYVAKILSIIKKNKVDIVLFQHPYFGWIIPFLKLFSSVKYAVRSHNVEFLRFKDLNKKWWRIFAYYEKWVHNQVDYVFCVTEDDKYFFKQQGIKSRLIDLPFGTEVEAHPKNKAHFKTVISTRHHFDLSKKIILFNGSLGYEPNRIGLEILVNKVYPMLLQQTDNFMIIICGSGLKEGFEQLKQNKLSNIIYCGFVDDIQEYFLAADIFVNPVQGGGGVKTKLIEALANGNSCVSSESGAKGVVHSTCAEKLMITKDYDEQEMSNTILLLLSMDHFPETPASFYEYYNWEKLMQKALSQL